MPETDTISAVPNAPTAATVRLDPTAFRERGYAVIGGLFDAREVQQLRATAREVIDAAAAAQRIVTEAGPEGAICVYAGDLLSCPALRHVLLDPRVIGAVTTLLGGEPVYFGDSSVRIGSYGMRGWHRDNAERRRWRGGPDWRGEFSVLRCGLYLQDSSCHSGGIALRPGSHRPGLLRPTLPKLVNARAGDLIVWSLRTVHSAEAVRLRGVPDLPLHPRLQTWLPQSLRVPDDGERIVMFMTFGLRGEHLDRFVAYLKSRDYMCTSWAASSFGADAWQEAERAGLHVFAPVPAYGACADPSIRADPSTSILGSAQLHAASSSAADTALPKV